MDSSPVINDSDEFVPMPTPDRVVAQDDGGKLDPIPFQFNDIRALAQRILKRATEQGQAKIAAAQKQVASMEKAAADKAYKEAYPKGEKDGYAKGIKSAQEEAQKEMQAQLETERTSLRQDTEQVKSILEQLANIMNENRQQLLAQAEGDLLLLALDIAKRLVGHELSIDAEAIRPLALEAIGLVTDRSAITVRVNPVDYHIMNEVLPELKAIFPDLGSVKIESDDSVERGGLMAATREAEVDMRLATRLAAFEEAILGFSGDAANAPWNAIDQDSIQAYKQHMNAQQQLEVFPELAAEQNEPETPPANEQPEAETPQNHEPEEQVQNPAPPEPPGTRPEQAASEPEQPPIQEEPPQG